MRCPKCGTQIDDNTRFCDYCGARVREDKPEDYMPAPKVDWKKRLFMLVPAVLLACTAIVLLIWSPWSAPHVQGPSGTVGIGNDGSDDADYLTPKIPYLQQTANDLVLMMDRSEFRVGQTNTVNLTAYYPAEYKGAITVTDENDLIVAQVNCDGSGVAHIPVTIREDAVRFGSLIAATETDSSSPVLFRVIPRVTDEQMQTLIDVCNGLGDALIANSITDTASDDALDFVQNWLEENEHVAQVVRNRDMILFVTEAGLVGGYSCGTNEDSYGAGSVEEAFEQWTEDPESVTEVVLEGQGAPTSSKVCLYAPDAGDAVIAQNFPAYLELFEEYGASWVETPDFRQGPAAVDRLAAAEYTDSALFALMAHGALLDRRNGDIPMLIYGVESWEDGYIPQDELRSMTTEAFYGTLDAVEYDHRILLVSVSAEEGQPAVKRLTVAKTATATMAEIADKRFENTVILYVVCGGAADTELVQFFFDHGAAGFVGAQGNMKDVCARYLTEKLLLVMGSGKVTYSLGQMARGQYPEELDRKLYAGLQEYAKEHGFAGAAVEEQVAQYLKMFETVRTQIQVCVPGQYLSGQGTLTCRVENTDGKPIAGVTVSLLRWQEHGFTAVSQVVTGESGEAEAELPYGVYMICAEGENFWGGRAWYFTPADSEAVPITLALYELSGVVTERDSGKPMPGATVTAYYGGNSAMHTQVTDENGAFRFDMLPGGNLTLKISLEGYSAENTAVRLDRDQERLLTVRKLRGYAIGHSNDVYYTSQAPAFSEEWIYYCDGSSLRRVGRDGKKDRQLYDMGEGVEAGWLNLDGDWLYYIGALEINGTMHTSVERIHVKDGSHEVLWNSPEGTLYEKAFGLMVRDGYVFYALEKDRNEDEWVEIRCLVPGTETPVVLARFDRLQQEGASGSYVGFNCDETGVYVHVNGGKDKHSWILRYDYTELNGELKTDTYDLQTQKNYEHTLYSGAGSLTPRQVVLFAEGFLLLGHESEVYLYEELAEGLKAHDRIRWDVSTANGSETVDKTFLAARHCVLEDTLIMPVGSGVYVSQNGKDAFREKLTLEHGFNLHNAWIGQDGQAVYMIYNYAGDGQTESKILLTVLADGSFTETVITK